MIKILLCLLLLTGCRSFYTPWRSSKLDLLISSSELIDRKDVLPGLSEAVEEWSNALGIEIDIKIGNWEEANLNSHRCLIRLISMPAKVIADYNNLSNTISYNLNYADCDKNFHRQVFSHELGHLFGLEHVDIESDIMYKYTGSDNIGSYLSLNEIELAKKNWLHQ